MRHRRLGREKKLLSSYLEKTVLPIWDRLLVVDFPPVHKLQTDVGRVGQGAAVTVVRTGETRRLTAIIANFRTPEIQRPFGPLCVCFVCLCVCLCYVSVVINTWLDSMSLVDTILHRRHTSHPIYSKPAGAGTEKAETGRTAVAGTEKAGAGGGRGAGGAASAGGAAAAACVAATTEGAAY